MQYRGVGYDYQQRHLAKWNPKDIITMRVYTLAANERPAKFIKSNRKVVGGDHKLDLQKHHPAVMLTHGQFDEGVRAFVDFYKNGTLVYAPILLDVGPEVPCFIAVKFCELKDCVE